MDKTQNKTLTFRITWDDGGFVILKGTDLQDALLRAGYDLKCCKNHILMEIVKDCLLHPDDEE